MGLNNRVFRLLPKGKGGKALSAGYPDCNVSYESARLMGVIDPEHLPQDEYATRIRTMHGATAERIFDAAALFAAIGYTQLDVVDFETHRGCEIVADLNEPQTLGEYDLVLDHGTIEHCFNIAQAAKNLAQAVKVGGYIVMHLPFNMYNHGFYNINPTWYYDFFEGNGFKIEHIEGHISKGGTFEVPHVQRFMSNFDNGLITMVARRTVDKPITYPIQKLYQGKGNNH